MACNQTLAGISMSCDSSKGGIVEVYISNYDGVTAQTSAETVISVSGGSWYKYSFKKNTGSMTSTLNVDDANGVNYVSTELVLQFNRMETAKRIEMSALSLGALAVIVKDANGKYWYLGLNESVSASAGTAQTGTARTDGNYYQITLQANDDTFPFEVLESGLPTVA